MTQFTVQLNNNGEMPQPFDIKFDCKDGKVFLVGDTEEIDLGEVVILPVVHKYKDTKMYNATKFPSTEPTTYINFYCVRLSNGNIFSGLLKKSSEGSYNRFVQRVLAFGTGSPMDLLKVKVTFSFKEETFKAGKSKTVQFNNVGETPPEQVQAIIDFFAAAEPMHLISHRNVTQYCEANGLSVDEQLPILLGSSSQKKLTSSNGDTK